MAVQNSDHVVDSNLVKKSCPIVNGEAEVTADTSALPQRDEMTPTWELDPVARKQRIRSIAGRFSGVYGPNYLDWVRDGGDSEQIMAMQQAGPGPCSKSIEEPHDMTSGEPVVTGSTLPLHQSVDSAVGTEDAGETDWAAKVARYAGKYTRLYGPDYLDWVREGRD